jgi:hypothetical protein
MTPGEDRVVDLVVRGDGTIVAAGSTAATEDVARIALVRYESNGHVDRTFAGDGVAVGPVSMPRFDVAGDLHVQRDGKILATANNVVARFDSGGRLDASFGQEGYVFGLRAVAALPGPDGSIFVVSPRNFRVTMLTRSGRTDFRFGRRGSRGFLHWSFDDKHNDHVQATAASGELGANAKVTVVGRVVTEDVTDSSSESEFGIGRYTTSVFCLVPNVSQKRLRDAREKILSSDCRVGRVRRMYSDRFRAGRVVSQRPRPGARLPENARVDLIVSRGRKR